jgi:hypothetical protein
MIRLVMIAAVALALAEGGQAQAVKKMPVAAQSKAAVPGTPDRALLDQYCVSCHNEKLKTGGLTLEKVDVGNVPANAEVLEKIVRKLRSGLMPPEGLPRPDQPTLDGFAAGLEKALDRNAAASPNPGQIASHRLNRAEYVNAIHDLLALDVNGAELLPGDMAGFGFDNNASVLAVTPSLMSRYMSAATKISRVAVGSSDNRAVTKVYTTGFGTRQNARMGEDMPFGTHGGLAVHHTFPLDGEYVFRVRLSRADAGGTGEGEILGVDGDTSQIDLRIDQALIKRFSVGGEFKGPDPGTLIGIAEDDIEGKRVHNYYLNADKDIEIRLPIKAGTRVVAAAYTDSLPSPGQSRGTTIANLEISGPFDGKTPEDTPSRKQIFICRPAAAAADEEACARKIIATLERRAYRRPVTDSEVQPLLTIYREGRTQRDFDTGIQHALEALLSSPKFLLRVEHEQTDAAPGSLYRLSDLELASRLSFFLWKSIPDDELLQLAEHGKLKNPDVLLHQVQRMLADARSKRFMDDFAEQWLQVRNIYSQDPDAAQFPDFEPTLRSAMATETELFFRSQVQEDRPIPELLSANYTFLNERLARHYGINDIYGSHFRRVTLTDERRFGLLGQASILTVSSYAHRTSVVLRGKWILENVLGSPPPPPPPNVPPLKENDGKSKPTALRERMEEHRKSAVCASCHARMDPLGFALEHYDAIGKWRETDSGAEINSTIKLSGKTIDSPAAFRAALLDRKDEFIRTVVEKLMTYALNRGVEYTDAPTVRQFTRNLQQNDNHWSILIADIVKSPQFQMGRTPVPDGNARATIAKNQ